MSRTDRILARLLTLHPKLIDLSLDRQRRLLADMGHPERRLPPIVHVAGTNGKGSTLAFLRAFLEAAGKRAHVYTSPHLVRFNERIRIAGTLVEDDRLNEALEAAERVNAGHPITFFEITTSAAFQLFAETPADFLLLETGLGGEFDSTNVVEQPLGTIITPVDYDHQSYLGTTLAEIARAKAGILKRGARAVFARQRDEALRELEMRARFLRVSPFLGGRDFDAFAQGGRLVYQDEAGLLDLPAPALPGPHQFENAGVAIAAARHFGLPVDEAAIAEGLRRVDWPARLSPLRGRLRDRLGQDQELWLDGGHNAHGAEALRRALDEMSVRRAAPLVLIVGMMNTRPPEDFIAAFAGLDPRVLTLTIPGEDNAHPAEDIAARMRGAGFDAEAMPNLGSAIEAAAAVASARVVICGSLYLAGHVLAENGTPPS